MILGLSSYTFGWAVGVTGHEPSTPMNEHALLDAVHSHGLALLQFGDNLPLETFDDERLKRIAERGKSENIAFEVGARGLTLPRITRYAEIARLLDAKLIRFVIDDREFQPTCDTVIGTLRDSLPILDGLLLGLENHDRLKASELRGIIDALDSENIGVCLDTANSLGAGEGLQTVVAALGPLTFNLHIKDFEVKRLSHMMGFTVSGTPAGCGLLDIPALVRMLAPFERCRTAILELWTPPEATLEETIRKEQRWASVSTKYLKPLFP